jgi:hypothetical protein
MGELRMSMKERRRLELMSKVKAGEVKLVKAAELAHVSYRHIKRIWSRYKDQGDAGLVHRGRGRTSNRQLAPEMRSSVLARYKDRYPDFGPTLACEYLAKDGWDVSPETLRQWLIKDGLWKRRRKRKKHRQWRERRAQVGELIQMDGSIHDWFEGRREWATLMVMIDDANNWTYARFYEAESTYAAMDVFMRYVRRRGLPQGLYADRHSIYRCEREARIDEDLRDDGPETQFARAMRQLQVDLTLANSPQAKGRVERRNAVFQDRLVKAMRLEGIDSIEAANEYLDSVFLKDLNRKFIRQAREAGNLHRRMPRGLHLVDVLGWIEPRKVQNNWTIRWHNRFFQIHKKHETLKLPGHNLQVFESINGRMQLRYRGLRLRFLELPGPPSKPVKKKQTKRRVYESPKNHPWSRSYKGIHIKSGPPPKRKEHLCGTF